MFCGQLGKCLQDALLLQTRAKARNNGGVANVRMYCCLLWAAPWYTNQVNLVGFNLVAKSSSCGSSPTPLAALRTTTIGNM